MLQRQAHSNSAGLSKPVAFIAAVLVAAALAGCGDSSSSSSPSPSTDNSSECNDDEETFAMDGEEYCVQQCADDAECGDNARCDDNGYCTTHPYADFEPAMIALNTEARHDDPVLDGTQRTTTLVYADQGGEQACDLSDRYIPGPAGHEAWFRAGQHLVYIDLGFDARHDSVEDHVCPQGVYEISECHASSSDQGREIAPPSGPGSGVDSPNAVSCASFVRVTDGPLQTSVNTDPWPWSYADETNEVIFHQLIAQGGTVELNEISDSQCEVNVDLDFGDGLVHRQDFVLTHPDGQDAEAFDPPALICEQLSQ